MRVNNSAPTQQRTTINEATTKLRSAMTNVRDAARSSMDRTGSAPKTEPREAVNENKSLAQTLSDLMRRLSPELREKMRND